MQKQAVLVCSVCALAAILTIAITMTLLKRGKNPAAPVEQPSSEVLVPGEEDISDHYQISETSAALLPETAGRQSLPVMHSRQCPQRSSS